MKRQNILLVILVALLATFGILYTYPKLKTSDLQNYAAGDARDITIEKPTWSDGKAKIKITIGKATTDSIVFARGVSKAAAAIADLTDLADYANVLNKTQAGKYSKVFDAVRDLLNYDEIVKLSPPVIIQTILGWTTEVLASAVDENCLTQAVKNTQRNRDGSVTVYRSTNFFSEDSQWYDGYYLYSQNEWSGGCTEKKVCLRFMYYDGRDTKCGLLW